MPITRRMLASIAVQVVGAVGRHDNYGSALSAQPGESQRRPATNASSQLIEWTGLPAPSCSRCLRPGCSQHTPRPEGHGRNLGTEILIPVTNLFEKALQDYANQLEDALEDLKAKRDDAVKALQDANELCRDMIGDAIDALYGHRMMRSHLVAFLDQCDLKAQALLKAYRDENRAARNTPPPAHFDDEYRFPPFEDSTIEMGHRDDAQSELRGIGSIVEQAIEAIQDDYRRLKEDYPDPHVLIGVNMTASSRLKDIISSAALPASSGNSLDSVPEAALRPTGTDHLSVLEGSKRS